MKIKVLNDFKDIHSQQLYKADSTIEVSKERYDEMKQNLAKYDGEFLKEIKQRKARKKKEVASEEEGA
ncbi:hypothetical protein [Corticicoccus populi]|uniref:Uncharacterized protein n=1 Tax=Corticicoccus populi TaxID=1812821 RepID=A0ABW5WS27_9STAP